MVGDAVDINVLICPITIFSLHVMLIQLRHDSPDFAGLKMPRLDLSKMGVRDSSWSFF